MQVTTIDEARALVGRTFVRDGKQRSILFSAHISYLGDNHLAVMFRDDVEIGAEYVETFNEWLAGATEVSE